MSHDTAYAARAERVVRVTPKDLPLCCPSPLAPLWQAHPRVYLTVSEESRSAQCPYCSTCYLLEGSC